MSRRALDLFCKAGGASMGLHRAGFDVTGVDIEPQPRYPFRFVRADALRPPFDLDDFDFIWASPPCQAHSSSWTPYEHPDLIPQTRELLAASGARTCIENVPGAPLLRLGFPAAGLIRQGWSTVVGGGRCSGVPREANAWHTNAAKKRAMGIDWMRREELAQAIPPAYAEFIGRAALAYIEAGRRAA